MESNHSGILHTLYSPDYIYSDYSQPFSYQCKVRYYRGKLQLVYPLKWVETHEAIDRTQNVKAAPNSIRYKEKQLVEELANLLNSDFSSKTQSIKTLISDYRTLVESEDIERQNTQKTVEALLVRFEDQVGNLHPYFYQCAVELFRDELITDCYNRYIKEIVETTSDYVVTADYVSVLVNGIMQFIDPLLAVAELRKNRDTNMQFAKEIFTDKLRRFLLNKILSCHRSNELPLASPLQQISDSLRFLELSCKFLHEYQDKFRLFSPDEKLEICMRLFSTNALEESYRFFCQEWKNSYNMFDENLMDKLDYIRVRLQSDKEADFHKFLADGMKPSKSTVRQYTMHNFSSVVFLALKELASNGDASSNIEKFEKRNTYIIKCANCGRYFVPTRSNSVYCDRKAPDSNKTCAEIGAKIKNKRNRSQTVVEYEKIKKRIAKKISDAKATGFKTRVDDLQTKLLRWDEVAVVHKEQLKCGNISEEEFINLINDAYNKFF